MAIAAHRGGGRPLGCCWRGGCTGGPPWRRPASGACVGCVFCVLRLASLALLGVGVAQALAQSIASANYSCRAAHSGGACMPVRPWILHTMFRHDTFVAVGGSRHPGRGRSDPGFASCVLHPLACFAVSSAVQEQGQRASPEDGPQVLQLFDGRLWRLTGCCALQHELEHLACPVCVRVR